MDSYEIKNKIVLKDKSGNMFEVPKTQGPCRLDDIEILTQQGKESLKGGEGGFPLFGKGKYEKKTGTIHIVKARYRCFGSKNKTVEFDRKQKKNVCEKFVKRNVY